MDSAASPASNEGGDDREELGLTPFASYAKEAMVVGSSLATLLQLELRLAAQDLGRLLVLALLLLPVLLLAWTSFCAGVSWFLYRYFEEPAAAFLTFLSLQMLALGGMAWLANRYRGSLSFPRTKEFVQTLARSKKVESKKSHP